MLIWQPSTVSTLTILTAMSKCCSDSENPIISTNFDKRIFVGPDMSHFIFDDYELGRRSRDLFSISRNAVLKMIIDIMAFL